MPLLIQGYGARVLVDGPELDGVAASLRDSLPPQVSIQTVEEPEEASAHFTVCRAEPGGFRILHDLAAVAQVHTRPALLLDLRARIELSIAVSARTGTFVHAGAVGWRGMAILVPGCTHTGKSTLVAELVRRGAVYYSDEYAVVDDEGRVHPYPRPIVLHSGGEELRPDPGTTALETALVVATAYRPGSTWSPELLRGARAVLPILDNVVVMRARPERGLGLAARLAPRIVTLRGQRPEASQVAPGILAFVDRLLAGEPARSPSIRRAPVSPRPASAHALDAGARDRPAEPDRRRICFVAIARDEAPVIERCLDSVRAFIDRVVIMDTGSVDGTPALVERWLAARGVSGQVIHEPWTSFGHNKTALMARAHAELAAGCDFIVWADCDEALVTETGAPLTRADKARFLAFADTHPEAGVFLFETRYANLRYWRWQAVRNDRVYRWEGSVHEMLVPATHTGSARVAFIHNHVRRDGNSSRNPSRITQDVAMLEADLARQPGEPRTVFYLAQSYEAAGQLDKAREAYAARVAIDTGYAEERFIAMLRLARIAKRGGQPGLAVEQLATATRTFPHRLEGWFELMLTLDELGLRQEAWSVGARAPWRDAPPVQVLFAEDDVYRWRHRFRLGVLGWYAGRSALGHRLLRDVARDVPAETHALLRSNLELFERRLPAGSTCAFSDEKAPDLVVRDGFLDDPDAARRFTLAQPFDIAGNYPGRRTRAFASEAHKEVFERLLGRRITTWLTAPGSYNGSFQYTTADMTTWHHRDRTTHAAVLYLTPGAPPDSGTLFFRHRQLGVEVETPDTRARLDADSNDPEAWILTDQVANRYNRLVVFNGLRTHRAGPSFGRGPSDGRLFQVFFFDVEPG